MGAYLQALYLRVALHAEWPSKLTAGFVAMPATSTVAEIVAGKSTDNFRPGDELWLALNAALEYRIPPADRGRFREVSGAGRLSVLTGFCDDLFGRLPVEKGRRLAQIDR